MTCNCNCGNNCGDCTGSRFAHRVVAITAGALTTTNSDNINDKDPTTNPSRGPHTVVLALINASSVLQDLLVRKSRHTE